MKSLKVKNNSSIVKMVVNIVNVFKSMKLFSFMGSKSKYKIHLQNTITKMNIKDNHVGTYIEAFAGSLGSLFHNLSLITTDKIVINDVNERLINLYKQIKSNPQLVYSMYEKLENKFQSMTHEEYEKKSFIKPEFRDNFKINSEFYKDLRDYFNLNNLDTYNASVMLFLLNHNFRGMYNENKKGGYNVSFNWNSKKINLKEIKNNIFNLSEFFNNNNVVFECLDIDDLISKYNNNDTFIYLDPPYINSSQYNQKRVGTKKKPSTNSFLDVSTHIKMLDSCKKYKYVMYSNNHHKDFIPEFDSYINFERTNTPSTVKSEKTTTEFLGYKVNTVVSTVSKSLPKLNINTFDKWFPKLVNNNLEVKKVSNGQDIITTGSICSGGGASEESMIQLGFNEDNHKNLFMCEWDDKVSDVYKMNFESENYFKDFYKTDWKKVRTYHLHLLFISTPCQEFSIASGQRKGLDSEKGQLYIDALIETRKMNVDKIINENVSSIVSSGRHYSKIKDKKSREIELNYIPNEKQLKKENWILLESQKDKYVYKSHFNPKLKIGRTLKIVEEILINDFSDYNIYMEIVNTKDFKTTPQNRKRFFLIMIKKELDLGFKFPVKQDLTTKLVDLLDDEVDESLIIKDREYIVYDKKENKDPKQLDLYGEILKKDGTKSNHRSSKIIVYPNVSPCLLTNGVVKIFHNGVVRYLSLSEQKRLHGFREEYLLSDNYRLSSYIMGNTLSPSVMKELIKGVQFMDEYNPEYQLGNNIDYSKEQECLSLVS